jgi:RNA polymerase sigma-70 factor (ECF subfamily)
VIEQAEIVKQAQAGSQEALRALIDQYHIPALHTAQIILGDPQDAEDAVQEIWIQVLHSLGSLRDPSRFPAWLYRMVRNTALRKRQQRATIRADIALQEDLFPEQMESHPHADTIPWLSIALHALSDKDYFVTSLHYFNGLSVEEIAQLLEVPSGTVKSRLFHARKILKKELMKRMNQKNEYLPEDFREVIGGMRGVIHWNKIFDGNLQGWSFEGKPIEPGTVPAGWSIVGENGLVGEEWKAGTTLTYGEPSWRDLELSLLITPLGGGNAQVLFRMDEVTNRFYVLDMLMGWQAIAIRRITHDDEVCHLNAVKLDVVNYPLRHGTEYALNIAIRGHSITTYVNGALVNRVTDGSWFHGKIGLHAWQSKTLFRDIRVRLLD